MSMHSISWSEKNLLLLKAVINLSMGLGRKFSFFPFSDKDDQEIENQ